MTSPRPLGLSHPQFVLLMNGAQHVPVEWRDRYLRAVADRLTGVDVTDDAVQRAVSVAVQRMSGETAA